MSKLAQFINGLGLGHPVCKMYLFGIIGEFKILQKYDKIKAG